MCGIAGGIVSNDRHGPVDVGVVARMNEFQRRRGPDGEGLWASPDGRIALGHRRLALIDLSDAGAQPMWDASRRFVVTFNGEIYNHDALRAELQKLGRQFATKSDTEVLLNAFAQWGVDALHRLRGMFAFALWDCVARELWLVRDPFGIKPLYYAQSGETLWFASQARALAQCAPVNTGRDPAGLVGFYLYGYVPEPFTWWMGVSALPAGHFLRVRAGEAEPRLCAYARIEDVSAPPSNFGAEQLREALVDSLRAHLVADAPVGVFLSAGVDSTALAALAAQCGAPLRTVTLAFDEFRGTEKDEAPCAEATARALGAAHQTIRLSRDEVLGEMDAFFSAMDQPTTDGLNTFLVSGAAKNAGLTAALSGLGGDELFGGYPSFSQIPKMLALGARMPARARIGAWCEGLAAPLATVFGFNPKYASVINHSGDLESAYFLRRCLHLTRELETLLDESWRKEGLERLGLTTPRKQTNATIMTLELTHYMRNQPLRDADWSSMAHSLEVRTPFLDMPLYNSLAPALSFKAPPTKRDLARAAGPLAITAAGRRKTGFVTPIGDWFRSSSGGLDNGLKPFARRIGAAFRTLPPMPVQGAARF